MIGLFTYRLPPTVSAFAIELEKCKQWNTSIQDVTAILLCRFGTAVIKFSKFSIMSDLWKCLRKENVLGSRRANPWSFLRHCTLIGSRQLSGPNFICENSLIYLLFPGDSPVIICLHGIPGIYGKENITRLSSKEYHYLFWFYLRRFQQDSSDARRNKSK